MALTASSLRWSLGLVLCLVSVGSASAEIVLTPGDFHTPHPETMECGPSGILFTPGESWKPSATTIPFPEELRDAQEILVTVYFVVPGGAELVGDVCFCACLSGNNPGDVPFDCPIPDCGDPEPVSEWGDDWLGSSEIIIPGYMSEAPELLHIAISRDTHDSPQDTYPGPVWFSAIKMEPRTPSAVEEPAPVLQSELEVSPVPFEQEAAIRYVLHRGADVSVCIFDAQGRLLERMEPGFQAEGRHGFDWNASRHGSGVYFVRLTTDGVETSIKTVKIE